MKRLHFLKDTLEKTRHLASQWPESQPLRSVVEQLEYLIAIESGNASDASKLQSINIGVIAARDVEDRNMAVANDLYSVSGIVEEMIKERA